MISVLGDAITAYNISYDLLLIIKKYKIINLCLLTNNYPSDIRLFHNTEERKYFSLKRGFSFHRKMREIHVSRSHIIYICT